jgi:tripartite-type tricarboxylate transporter receptor subunit TctC
MRGDAQMYFVPVNIAKEMVEAGKVNAIAAATAQRWPDMPDVPTFTEAGLPFVYDSWFGLLTQAAVPRPIVQKINKDVTELLKSPETIVKLKAQFVIPVTDTPEAFDEIIRRETANLAEVFKEAGVGN